MSRAAAVMHTPRMRASAAHRLARGYSTAIPPPGKTPVPQPRRRGFLGRAVFGTVFGTALFYGASVPVAQRNAEYKRLFEERVYLGKEVLDFFEKHHDLDDIRKELDTLHLDDTVARAASQVRTGFTRLSDKIMQNEHVQNTRDEVEKHAADLQAKIQRQIDELKAKAGDEGHILEKQVQDLRANSSQWLEQAAELAEKSVQQVRSRATDLVQDVKERLPEDVRNVIPLAEKKAGEPLYEDLPVGFEAPEGYAAPRRDRKLEATKDAKARLRSDPQAPKLPQLAPSLSKLVGSEPIVSQLAGTIDELAAFVRDTPAGQVASGVLESAQADLQQLVKRLDQIKETDAKKLEKQLAKQAKEYEAEITKAAKQATGDLDKRDKDWQKKLDKIQAEQTALFKGRLAKELETQSAIINERLREEVMAQGVELQRKWSREIKAKVEQERAGRLARLDELATELHRLEAVSLDNAKTLDDNIGLHTLSAALRKLRTAIDGAEDAGEEAHAYVRRTFSKELDTLRRTPKAQDNELIQAALAVIDQTGAPQEGVESVPTLHEWFAARLAPRLRSVALLPEQGAGVLSYLTSMALSPLLFSRKGLIEGQDVASTVARAEWYLEHKDLDRATRELNQLHGWAKILAGDWLEAARKRLEVDQAIGLVEKESEFNSMLKT